MTEPYSAVATTDADALASELDEIAGLAARVTGMPIAVITRREGSQSWVMAEVGLPQQRGQPVLTPFAWEAAAGSVELAEDMASDARFRDSPYVTGAPHLRFYASAPLSVENGAALGTLTVLDVKPHPEGLSADRIAMIDILARQAAQTLEMRRRSREAERRQSNLYSLISKAPIGVVQADLAGRIIFINAEYAELLGRRQHQLGGSALADSVHPDDLAAHVAAVAAAVGGAPNVQIEERYVGPEGNVVWASVSISITRDLSGKPLNVIAVAQDFTERKRAIEELAASERRLRATTDAMPQMVWSTPPDGATDYFNKRWYDFMGVDEGATFGEAWSSVLHVDDQKRAEARWRHSVETGEPYEIEIRIRHHSGEHRWVLARGLPIYDKNGAIERWFGTCTDIEDLKRSEEARDLLANELSHRIKNIFAVVGGLVSLTARGDETARPFAQALRERLNALSLAHEYVRPQAAGEGAPVDDGQSVHGLMRMLVRPYADTASKRFVFEGEDAPIGPRTATALALVMHEQATNAVKYGALASEAGRVVITGEKSGSDYVLVWREDGGQLVAGPPARRGFGTDMAARSAAGQLGGKIEHLWETQGLVMRLAVPMENLPR